MFFGSKCVKVVKMCILHIYRRADLNALRTEQKRKEKKKQKCRKLKRKKEETLTIV